VDEGRAFGPRRRTGTQALAATSLLGSVIFSALWMWSGVVTPGYSSRSEFISALAAEDASHPGRMLVGFVALAVSLGAIAVMTWRSNHRVRGALIAVSAVGFLGAGLVRQECSTALDSCIRRIPLEGAWSATNVHGYLATTAFVTALVALGSTILPARRAGRRTEYVGGCAALAIAVGSVVGWNAFGMGGDSGTVQRLVITVVLVWGQLLAWRWVRDTRAVIDLTDPGADAGRPHRLSSIGGARPA
jgi:hypothetical protein